MDIFFNMSSAQAAALHVGLLVLIMLGLKFYVGGKRGTLKIASGETTPEFSKVTRVQLNAVEDVPVLMAGILGLALLGMPAWYIHAVGLTLSSPAFCTPPASPRLPAPAFRWGALSARLAP